MPTATPTATATHTPTATPTPTLGEVAAASIAEIVPWFASPPDARHSAAGQTITAIWLEDPDVGKLLAGMSWVVDGIVDPESLTLGSLSNIAMSDAELARLVLGYDWLADGPDPRESEGLRLLGLIAGRDATLANLTADFPWFAGGIDGREEAWLRQLRGIAENDPALARVAAGYSRNARSFTDHDIFAFVSLAKIAARSEELADVLAGYAWVDDGLAAAESDALAALSVIAARDVALAGVAAAYPWVVDGIASVEWWALSYVEGIVTRDLALANVVAAYSWIADDITGDERWGLYRLNAIAALDVALAGVVAGYSWVSDDMTGHEQWVLSNFEALAASDLPLASALAGYAWISDDFPEDEQRVVRALSQIHGLDPAVARMIAGLAWVVDDINVTERNAIEAFHRATIADPTYAQAIASLPWARDDITQVELYAVDTLQGFASKDDALAQTVISLPWVIDDITELEHEALRGLVTAAPGTGRRFLEMVRPPEELADDPDQWDMEMLVAIARLDQETFEDLADVPWFNDGLNGEERALLTVLPLMRSELPHVYNGLVHSRQTLSLTVSLPLAGEVDIWVFADADLQPEVDPARAIADTARIAEGLLGVPFPNDEIILVVTPPASIYIDLAAYYGRFMVLWRAQGGTEVPFIPHETAHYFFTGGLGPTWLVEGGAEFIEAYTRDRLGIESLEERRPKTSRRVEGDCISQGMGNIRELNERVSEAGRYLGCNYSLGEFFLTNLFRILGEEAFGAAIRDLYLLSRSELRWVTEEEIYQAFREHTPPRQVRAFQYLYERWHGGAFLDE